MILPAPLRNGQEIIPVDLSKKFNFQSCEDCFPTGESKERKRTKAKKESLKQHLEVISVGAYNVSIAKTLDDLDRINPDVFQVQPKIKEVLQTSYPSDFGFVICCFDSTKKMAPHPLGYVSDFALDGSMFIPCKHEHDGTGTLKKADFDHRIFTVNSPTLGTSIEEVRASIEKSNKDLVEPKTTPTKVFGNSPLKELLQNVHEFRRHIMVGEFDNTDLLVKVSMAPGEDSSSQDEASSEEVKETRDKKEPSQKKSATTKKPAKSSPKQSGGEETKKRAAAPDQGSAKKKTKTDS